MSNYFSENNYQVPAAYIEILGVQIGLVDFSKEDEYRDLTVYEKPATPLSLYKYPNLITSLVVKKIVDGEQNIYTINMKYKPQDNEDPSFIDKLISANSTQNESRVIIAYGDSSADGFFRKKDEVLLTSYKISAELETGILSYSLTATSTGSAYDIKGPDGKIAEFTFEDQSNTYVSSIIKKVYNDSTYGLRKIFPGGIRINNIDIDSITEANAPDIKWEEAVIEGGLYSPFEYLKYLVKKMISKDIGTTASTDANDTTLSLDDEVGSSTFVYAIVDSYRNQSFEIFSSKGVNDDVIDTIIIGAEGSNVVSYEFTIDHSYGIAVNYGNKNKVAGDRYYIADNGEEYLIEGVTGEHKNNSAVQIARDKAWWKDVSSLSTGAKLVVRNMIKQFPLMSNVRLTIMINGRVHFLSGKYFIVSYKDTLDSSGFFTELSLFKKEGASYAG